MPELPSSGVAQNASERTAQALTPDAVSAVLADFHAWLTALTATAAPSAPAPLPQGERGRGEGAAEETIDLHTLLGQFLAVRQEVNLQTRAVRAQQEQNSETLRQLTAALEALRQSQARGEQARQQAVDEAVRPLLKTLIDLYDALSLAGREMQRLSETVSPSREQSAVAMETPRFLSRFFNRERERERERQKERQKQLLSSLLTGYTMSLQRIERALRQHGLEAIAAMGERFDAERMEAVEAVVDSGRPSGEVIDEVRRGYLWNGRVFRYAQVRVAKS